MEKSMIESYLNEIEKEITEGRFISAHQNVKFLLKNIYGHEVKEKCEHCEKLKSEHFHKYEKQYDEGLRDNYYCNRYGIVKFALCVEDAE